MERCRSSEAALTNSPDVRKGKADSRDGRDGRRRDVKATSLLFHTVPSAAEISAVESRDQSADHSGRSTPVSRRGEDDDDKMDVDEIEVDVPALMADDGHRIWGMPKWGREEERKEVRKGVRLVGMEEVSDCSTLTDFADASYRDW
jgi:dual specificity MAP kinase phosphatase